MKKFLFKADKVLIPVIIAFAFLRFLGAEFTLGNEGIENSVLSSLTKAITTALIPYGVTDNNYLATVGYHR